MSLKRHRKVERQRKLKLNRSEKRNFVQNIVVRMRVIIEKDMSFRTLHRAKPSRERGLRTPFTELMHGYQKSVMCFFCLKKERFSAVKCAISIFFSLLCTLYCELAHSQNEVQFSGSFAMPLATNPGAAGRSGQVDATAAFRQQWVGFKGSPTQFFLAADMEVKFLKNFHGIAAVALQDKSGVVTTLNLFGTYSYHIYLDKGILGIGTRLGVYNIKFEGSDLSTVAASLTDNYHQQSDESIDGLDDSQSAFDVGLGAFYQSELSYLSLSMLHLTAPELEMDNGAIYNIRPVLTLGMGRLLGQDVRVRSFEPRFAMRTDFASLQMELSLNVNLHQRVWFGVGLRPQDAVIFGVGVRLRNGLDLSYDYDLTTSKIIRYSSGSHEIVARYSFDFDRTKPTKRYKSVRIL